MRLASSCFAIGLLATACHHEPAQAPEAELEIPGPPEARRIALEHLAGQVEVDRQITELQGRVVREPKKLDHWISLGRAWIRKARESADPGYYVHADACAQVALAIAPASPLARDLHGLVLLNNHRFAEASDLATGTIAGRSDDAMALGILSDAQLELGDFNRAVDAAQKMVELKPNLPSYSRAAYLRWLTGDAQTAKSFWRMALDAGQSQKDPEPFAWTLVQAALLFWSEGDWEGADYGFDRALAAFEKYPPALVGKAKVALARGEAAAAVKLLEQAYEQSPLLETAGLLYDARLLAGDEKAANTLWAQIMKQGERTDPRTLALLLATHNREPDFALRLAETERSVRGDIHTLDTLAWASYRKGLLPQARAASDQALRLGTRDARLFYHAGAIRLAMGEESAGRKLINSALAQNRGFDVREAQEARKLLSLP